MNSRLFTLDRLVAAIRGANVTEYFAGLAGSLRLDVGRPDYLAPLLGFVGGELSKVGGRAWKHRAAQVGKPRLELGISEGGIDFLVEFRDDFGGRAFGRADPVPKTCLVARHKFADGRDVRHASERVAVVTASGRSLPALMYSI